MLLISKKSYNVVILLIDKYRKKILLFLGKTTYTIANWAETFMNQLDLINQDIFKIIIFDYDPKFLFNLWTILYKQLSIKFFYLTTYYLQTNGASECINQITKIAFCFYLHIMKNSKEQPNVLPWIQALINNSQSVTIIKTFKKIALSFMLNQSLNLLARKNAISMAIAWIDARDIILFI